MAVAPDHATQVAALIRVRPARRVREVACSHQRVAEREMRTVRAEVTPIRHVLPAALGQEAVIAAREQPGPVFKFDLPNGLDGRPVVEHTRAHIAPVAATTLRPDDLVAHSEILDWAGAPVREKHRSGAPEAK